MCVVSFLCEVSELVALRVWWHPPLPQQRSSSRRGCTQTGTTTNIAKTHQSHVSHIACAARHQGTRRPKQAPSWNACSYEQGPSNGPSPRRKPTNSHGRIRTVMFFRGVPSVRVPARILLTCSHHALGLGGALLARGPGAAMGQRRMAPMQGPGLACAVSMERTEVLGYHTPTLPMT